MYESRGLAGWVFLLLVLFWGVAAEAFAAAIDPEQLAKDCRPAVLFIQVEDASGAIKTMGSGFLVTSDGILVTNYHVIDGGSRITAKSYAGREFSVQSIVATDPTHDLAVLKLFVSDTPWLPLLDDERSINPGSPVVVIGNPRGLEGSISQGIVSAVRNVQGYGPVFQMSAAISPGSSGSPMLTADGKVLGVATFIMRGGESLNFAISVASLKALLGWSSGSAPMPAKAPAASKDPVAQNTDAELYRPAPSSLGSPEEDRQAVEDPAFARLSTLEKEGKNFRMLELAKELAARFPKSALAQRRLSDAYYYADFNEECLAACKKALDMDPKSGRGWNNLAIIYHVLGNDRAALRSYREGIKAAPSDAKLWMDYGQYLSEADPKAATEAARTAVALLKEGRGTDAESKTYSLLSDSALLLRDLGQSQEAYEAALAGVKLHAVVPEAWLTMAECAVAVQKYGDVKPYLDRAKTLGAPLHMLYSLMSDAEQGLGHWDIAADLLIEANRFKANDQALLQKLIAASLKRFLLDDFRIGELAEYAEALSKLDGRLGQEARTAVENEILRRRKDAAAAR